MQIYEDAGWQDSEGAKPRQRSHDNERYPFIEVHPRFDCSSIKSNKRVLTLIEFLEEQEISDDELPKQPLSKFTVFTHDDALIQLWVRDGTAQIRKSGRKGKIFTVTGDLDLWVKTFFEGYLSAA